MYQYDDYYSGALPPTMLSSESAALAAQLADNSVGQTTSDGKNTIVVPSISGRTPMQTVTAERAAMSNQTVLMLLIAAVIAWHLLQD